MNMKQNGDIVPFLKQKDYIMVNNSLGQGSFGKTVLLKDPFIDELFVAKKYEPEIEEIRETFYKNFLDEIKILHKLNHRNIVRVYDYYPYEKLGTGYILMEYIEGETIEDYIVSYMSWLSPASLDDIFLQLIDGFDYIEKNGIIHRDIREGNILVDKSGVVKIIDFGIGKFTIPPNGVSGSTDSLVYDVNRMNSDTLPNEYDEGKYTSKTDMFYLGELFNRLLKNCNFPDEVDFSYERVLEKMMRKDPKNRYENFAQIKEEIAEQDFLKMDVSQEDKEIYQAFSNAVIDAMAVYTETPKFVTNVDDFIGKLERVVQNNIFEDIIQSNADVLRCLVLSGFKYSTTKKFAFDNVKKFLNWMKKSNSQSQNLILSNLVSKLSTIKVEILEDDVPF